MFQRKLNDNVVYVANGKLEAESVKILLESFGISAFINQESAGSTYGLTVGPLGEVDVFVPEKYIIQAKSVIEDMQKGLLELPDNEGNGVSNTDPDEN
ncbi:MAG: DUF2007 domain-containing protein [Anaerolineaceae bacterium]